MGLTEKKNLLNVHTSFSPPQILISSVHPFPPKHQTILSIPLNDSNTAIPRRASPIQTQRWRRRDPADAPPNSGVSLPCPSVSQPNTGLHLTFRGVCGALTQQRAGLGTWKSYRSFARPPAIFRCPVLVLQDVGEGRIMIGRGG